MTISHHAETGGVLVTGASRGIGRATALAFARSGAGVALLARESPDLRTIAEELDDLGAECVVAPCDVRDAGSVERSIAYVEQELGGIDVLVNNAGGGRYAPFGELTEKDWDDMVSLNVAGMVNVTRAVLPHMQSRRRGHIINISSIRGLEGAATMTAYTASKFAVTGLTRALRLELAGSGVLVSLVSPGGVKTGFGGVGPEHKDPSWMEPSAVADLIVQVASFRGRGWITEVTIMPEPIVE